MSKFRLLCSGLMLAAVALSGCGGGDVAGPPKVANGTIVAVGDDLLIAVSRDSGTTWTKVMEMPGLPVEQSLMFRASYVNGRYFAFGWRMFTSTDGVTFTELQKPVAEWFGKVVFAEGIYLSAGGYGHVIESNDGITWTPVTVIPGVPLTGMRSAAYGNGKFALAAEITPKEYVVYMSSDRGKTWQVDPSLKTLNVGFCNGAFKDAKECGESDAPAAQWTGYGYIFRSVYPSGAPTRLERSGDGVNYMPVNMPAVRDMVFVTPPA